MTCFRPWGHSFVHFKQCNTMEPLSRSKQRQDDPYPGLMTTTHLFIFKPSHQVSFSSMISTSTFKSRIPASTRLANMPLISFNTTDIADSDQLIEDNLAEEVSSTSPPSGLVKTNKHRIDRKEASTRLGLNHPYGLRERDCPPCSTTPRSYSSS